MDIGVFIPIANNGWLTSTTSPQYLPTFDLNREVVQRAERYGFDFALAMVKLRGAGGVTRHWDYNLEPFTLIAALAAVTSRISVFATVPTLVVPPAYAARMAVTIDSVSGGRFGINLITGWQKAEYEQMGLWPGDEHFATRYDYLDEYVTILKELWATGVSDFKGRYFTMDDCRLLPMPQKPVRLMCAAASDRGMQFSADHCDFNFCTLGVGDPIESCFKAVHRFRQATASAGRTIPIYMLTMIIADETDEAARAKFDYYASGTDYEAVEFRVKQAAMDVNAPEASLAGQMRQRSLQMSTDGKLIGSYETIARQLDAMEAAGIDGVMLTFDDFIVGIEQFGQRIQPLMRTRSHLQVAA